MHRPVIAALALALAACGGGGGLSISELPEEVFETICAKAHECRETYPGTDAEFEEEWATSEAACVDLYADLLPDEQQRQELEDAIDRGTVIYDESAAQRCLDAQRTEPCETVWTAPAPADCETFLEGTVADGDACVISEECASDDAFCSDGVCTVF